MLAFPEKTNKHTKIAKEHFYAHIKLNKVLKRAFVDEIESVWWSNIFSTATLNVAAGEQVTQIDLIHIQLKQQYYLPQLLETIEKAIPRHLIFLLQFEDRYQLLVNYKEATQKGQYKIIANYKTKWTDKADLALSIQGLNLDQVYENMVYQIAGEAIAKQPDTQLKTNIQLTQKQEKTLRKIADLEKKLRNEQQFNIQMKIAKEIRELREEGFL